jgi:endonuclease/exonuclease/phosphatase family metal-dependent hydrolase
MKKLLAFILSVVFVSVAQAQIRVVNYNVHYCSADMEAMDKVLDAASEDGTCSDAIPVSVFMFQEVNNGVPKKLHGLVGDEYSMAVYTNKNELSGRAESGGAQAMFYHSEQLLEIPDDHKDIYTGATRNADRWHLVGIGENDGVDLWVYSAHLKASNGSENKEQRLFGAKAILEDISTLPEGANVIVVGDMNFYSIREPAYQAFIKVLLDPLGTDEWSGEDDAEKHTQSPRKVRGGGLAYGGMDDRFDFQFISKTLQDGRGLDLVRGSYHSLGNDGKHYDIAINDGDNEYFSTDIERSNELATALHEASDHLPVIADYEVVKQEKPESGPDTSN